MRRLFTIFIFLILLFKTISLTAQGEALEYSYLNDLSAFARIPLDTLWDYYPDSNVSFDALKDKTDWTKANPIYLQDAKGKQLAWSGIGWFKQSFMVPDSLNGKLIALRIGHFGASEVYLDDKLVNKYGDVFATSGKNKSFISRQPFTATLNNASTHTLFVRYATHTFDKIIQPRFFYGFYLTLAPVSESYRASGISTYHAIFSTSLYLSFCIFFFCVYFFYPQRIASLLSAFYLLNFSILFSSVTWSIFATDAGDFSWANLLWKCSVSLAGIWGLLLNYAFYYKKLPLRTWLIVPLMIVNILNVIYPTIGNPVLTIINTIVLLEAWRILYLGLRDKRTGFWILALFQIVGTLFFLVFIANVFHLIAGWRSSVYAEAGGFMSDLCAPLMFALHLAWEFGSNNRDLQKQLGEVQKLSEENLEQEKEKQQILATQNETLEQQVTERTTALNQSLVNLKATQTQLVQKEKLASLGELTAGIAHEIQNPLNFVNNFSELNVDLAKDIETEIHRPEIDKKYVEELFADLNANQEKINHHGKRASGIVKGMLEHSRNTVGERQMTDVNNLIKEFLPMSFHGMRAKDQNFNADYQMDLDESLEKINIVPQEISRVLVNLFNNAFYAVNEKRIAVASQPSKGLEPFEGYAPVVNVCTKRVGDFIEIIVKDNGTGILENIQQKIFQPFFTTKPPGEGTGLGLSLSYDMITKGHGGTLEVQSTEGVGSVFIIRLKY